MTEGEQKVEKALATFWDTFLLSPLGVPRNLAQVGLHTYSGESAFQGWDGTGDFYGRTEVHLLREDGTRFTWTVAVLFEQGENEGEYWQQGGPYAHVGVTSNLEEGNVGLYGIGHAEIPSDPFKLVDLPLLAESLVFLSEKCFQDLEFIYHSNRFDSLLDLVQQRIDGHGGWDSNPLRSSP